jgi:hypothetical protein
MSKVKHVLMAGATSSLLACPSWAAQFGMVVGVDDYKHFEAFPAPVGELSDLEGAVNDASLIAASMRRAGIDLPDNRILIDSGATVESFLAGWKEMTRDAKSGDTIIVSFSGHGGQEKEVSEPFDEKTDGLDETIMFHEFDPTNPRIGRLSDDQLRELLSKEAAYNIIWVMDSCHSAGLTRSVNSERMGLTRSGGVWDIPLDPILGELKAQIGDDEADDLPNVTQILATASEDRLVTETRFGDRAHGALSWFFAKALDGAADLDENGSVTRKELSNFLEDRVFTHMNQTQQPRILPRGDNEQAFALSAESKPLSVPKPSANNRLPVRFIGSIPPGLQGMAYTEVQTNALLTFVDQGGKWEVFNHTGDPITTITGGAGRMVARGLVLDVVRASKRDGVPPVGIRAAQDNAVQEVGARVGFTFFPPDPSMAYLTLFNIASNGDVQFLYPSREQDNKAVGNSGFPIQFQVIPPLGADQLVAVFCSRPPLDLQALLDILNGQTALSNALFFETLRKGNCQTGLVGLFTKNY